MRAVDLHLTYSDDFYTMTIRRYPESTSKDDHYQPFLEEDQFRAHGVHSVRRTQSGTQIVSRDGWHYELRADQAFAAEPSPVFRNTAVFKINEQ